MLKLEILEKLKSNSNLSCKQIADELKTSISKIRIELGKLEEELTKNGAELSKKRGRGNGYILSVTDEEKFQNYCNNIASGLILEQENLNSPDYRIKTICEILLNSDEPIKSEDIANQINVSSRQLNNDLKVVRLFFKDYSLEIINKPYHGMKLQGNEFNKRLCLANLYMQNYDFASKRYQKRYFDNAENEKIIKRIREILQTEAYKSGVQFSDISLENLIVHLFIIVKRPAKEMNQENSDVVGVSDKEMLLTKNIINKLSKEFKIKLNYFDYRYIAIHIAGKRAYLDDEVSIIPDEAKKLTEEVLNRVDSTYKTAFANDVNLKLRLQLHFAPLLIRIQNGIASSNPLLDDIKSQYAMSYEIALFVGDIINDIYDTNISQAELAYIAMHFELSMYQTKLKKYKVLLVCHTGRCSSEILKQQVLSRFSNYIYQLDTCPANQTTHLNLEEYTFIFTTVPIHTFTRTPIYQINDFLDENNAKKINRIFERGDFSDEMTRKFFPQELFLGEINASDRDDTIKKMCAILKQKKKISKDFYNQVIERERIAPTDYGNNVALPHPIHMSDNGETYSCVAILKKPIRWENKMVKIVFLNNISKGCNNIQNYYYLLSKFITSDDRVESLVKHPDYEYMIRLINEKN